MKTIQTSVDRRPPAPENVTTEDARYAYDLVARICSEVGPGLPATPQERERAAIIQGELELHLGVGNVAVEEFTCAPGAFLGVLPLSAVFLLIAASLNLSTGRLPGVSPWATAACALAFSILSIVVVLAEFILSFELVDPFFPKAQSVNVIGKLCRPGTQNVKRLLLLSGHHDSAMEITWLAVLGNRFMLFSAVWLLGYLTVVAMSIVRLAGLVQGNSGAVALGTLSWVLLAFPIAPSAIYALFFSRGRNGGGIVPGAVDNLAACALTVALCRFLVHHPACIPPDTEIRFITFGSEEARLRGSRRYVARHLDELARLDARLLNIEMVAHPQIAILTSDVNGTVRNSPEMVASVVAAAKRAGVPYTVKPGTGGVGSDAAPFSQAGLKATTLFPFQMPEQLVAFYHQSADRPEVLTLEPLFNVLQLALEWIRCGGE